MTTILKKKLTILQIEKLFADRETLNIRFFKCIDENFSEDFLETPFLYVISLRHNENENPNDLLKKAINKLNIKCTK